MSWLKTKQVRNRILFTLLMICLFQVGTFITLPFISINLSGGNNTLSALLNLSSGGALSRFGFLALGISPYITASIIMQLLQKTFPYFKKLSDQGAIGRTKLSQYTRYISLVFGFLSAYSIIFSTAINETLGVTISANYCQKIGLVILLSIGALFVTYLGERIDEKGIGQGASVLIAFGILSNLPNQIYTYYKLFPVYKKLNIVNSYYKEVGFILLIFIIMVTMCIIANRKEYKFPMQSKLNSYRIQAHYFPIKLLASSVMPVIFATAFISIFAVINTMFDKNWTWINYTTNKGFIVYCSLIFLFTFMYNYIQIDGDELQKSFNENSAYIIDVSNLDTSKYINKKLLHITCLGAPVLTIIAVFAVAIDKFSPLKYNIQFTGMSLLIVVGVLQEMVHQIKGLSSKHNYRQIL